MCESQEVTTRRVSKATLFNPDRFFLFTDKEIETQR